MNGVLPCIASFLNIFCIIFKSSLCRDVLFKGKGRLIICSHEDETTAVPQSCLSLCVNQILGGYLAIIPDSSFTTLCTLRLTVYASGATLTPMVPGTGSRDCVSPKSGGQDPLTSDEVSSMNSGPP